MQITFSEYRPKVAAATGGFKVDFRKSAKNFKDSFLRPTVATEKVNLASFLASSIRAGYGTILQIRKHLKLGSPRHEAELRRYILARVGLMKQALRTERGKSLAYFDAWRFVESTEKGVLSFLVGMSVSELAMARSLKHSGTHLEGHYHYRLYSDPAVSTMATIKLKKGKLPDFLIKDATGGWHVVEAKGISKGTIWSVAKNGLQQARRVTTVALTGRSNKVKSHNVVIASAKGGGEISVSLVDPEPENDEGIEIAFYPHALDIADAVALIELFDCWEGSTEYREQPGGMQYLAKKVPELDIEIGIPQRIYEHKKSIIRNWDVLSWLGPYLKAAAGRIHPETSRTNRDTRLLKGAATNIKKRFPDEAYLVTEQLRTALSANNSGEVNSIISDMYAIVLSEDSAAIESNRQEVRVSVNSVNGDSSERLCRTPDGLLIELGPSWFRLDTSPESAEGRNDSNGRDPM